ncbi:hypothetical protein P8452_76453 [Trifolium repens]|nr:hypothetical protein P8452_76453 [Trifolium repens]
MGNSSKDHSGDASPDDVPFSDSKIYSASEKVLAYHDPHIYKVKVEIRKSEWKYLFLTIYLVSLIMIFSST